MRVILTFSEIQSFDNLAAGVAQQLRVVLPNLKSARGEKPTIMELLDAEQRVPNLISVDMIGGTVTFTVPEELVIESAGIVGVFYEELIELVPLIVTLGRMVKKAARKYEASIEALGQKFSKLVKKPAAE